MGTVMCTSLSIESCWYGLAILNHIICLSRIFKIDMPGPTFGQFDNTRVKIGRAQDRLG